MLQIKNLTITHKKDLRTIVQNFSLVLNDGDKAVMIGEEGNGKSTVLKWIYDPELIENYAEGAGERILNRERLGYLAQELPAEHKEKTLYEYFSAEAAFWEQTPKDLSKMAGEFGLSSEFFYGEQKLSTLSGGEKIKAQMLRLLMTEPTVLLLDEPSNDIDIETLEWLEKFILGWPHIVLYISHDETLIERTANMVIHMEQLKRKTESRYTVAKMPYTRYIEERKAGMERQERLAQNDRREKEIRDEKIRKMEQKVGSALDNISKADRDTIGRLLKKKMKAVKSMEKRFEREDEGMTEMPETEEAIFFKLGDKESKVPAGKTVIEYSLDRLMTPDGERVLARDINLLVRGSEKLCFIGKNGAGKTTLLRKMAEELLARTDIHAEYMPQNYEELLDLSMTPVDFLDTTGEKEERTRIRTYLGSLKYTADEMDHPMAELSGGQKAKVLLLKMSLSKANVLILDEPTRNFSPLSGGVIRKLLSEFPGAILSISHDRKYMEEVCDTVYRLTEDGLRKEEKDLRE
ncbi:MAG: ABC-F family ATP-binding cassette domain-containing protein [Lachnospiraceae bacterium]|nr:ABC-F family ATP-binding cassette domain-containing protein [Lachnospiraceae bacterium]